MMDIRIAGLRRAVEVEGVMEGLAALHFGEFGAFGGDHLHHLAGVFELFEEAVEFGDGVAAASGDALFAAAVDAGGVLALVGGHGGDHGFDGDEGVVADFDVFGEFAHAWDHADEVFHVAHFFDLAELGEEVVEVVFVVDEFFLDFAGFGFVVLFLCAFDERDDVAHAEDAVGHTVGVEDVECIHFFAYADELDGFFDGIAYGEGGTATGIAIEFGEHDAVVVDAFVEGFGGVDGVLSGHGVNDEKGFLRIEMFFEGGDLGHHGFIDGETAGGIDDDDVDTLGLGVADGFLCDIDGVEVALFGEDGHADLAAEGLELADGGGAIDVAGDEHDVFGAFCFQMVGQFGAEGGFAGALQTCDEDDGGSAFDVDVNGVATHQFGELFVDDFDHELTWFDALDDVATQGFGFDFVGKFLGDGIADVGV